MRILLAFLIFISTTHALELKFWSAFRSGNTFMTNYDVENYICALHLSDDQMIAMFKEAGSDFNKYETLRRTWAQRRLQSGLKQLAYVHTVQKHAKTNLNNRTNAFKISSSDYFDMTQDLETKTLREWLDQRMGIVKARIAFAKKLKEIGYPHKENQDPTELYFEWYDLQKRRLKEKIRLEEVQKYEYLMSLGYQKEFYVRPVEIFDFKRDVTGIIEDTIQGKRLTPAELAKIVSEDERISIMASQINLLGPNTIPLNELSKEAPAVFAEFREKASELFTGPLTKANDYIQAATGLSQRMSSEELEESIKSSREKFLLGNNDYTELMKAKIFELSLELKKGSQMDESIVMETSESLHHRAREIIADAFAKPETVARRLEDHLINELSEGDFEGATSKAISLMNWVAKFQLKKLSLEIVPMAQASLIDATKWEGQDRIEKYLAHKQYQEKLDEFRRTKLAYVGEYIDLNPQGERNMSGHEAWSYVLEQF